MVPGAGEKACVQNDIPELREQSAEGLGKGKEMRR